MHDSQMGHQLILEPENASEPVDSKDDASLKRPKRNWGEIWESLLRMGLGEIAMRVGTGLSLVAMVLLVIWVMSNFYLEGNLTGGQVEAIAAPLPTATRPIEVAAVEPAPVGAFNQGISRVAQIHTQLPTKPRFDVITYTVEKGDTIFAIADKFNLKPETIFWGNYYTLGDDPHRLQPDQELNILPVDGVYYEWHAGDGLNGVAQFYGVEPEDIVNWPGNRLDINTLGDFSNPNIEPGTWLIVPGGTRAYVSWSVPNITREDPAVANIMGPGACGPVDDGPVGTGTFVWPSVERYLSGYDYSPETNHYGIDIAGDTGYNIFATDSGVVVYAGWNDWGYGNVIVIDHGNGWQSLYGHLDTLNVGCGSYVYQGDVIGGMGSTGNSSGPHLHFELYSEVYGKVNPWNFVQ